MEANDWMADGGDLPPRRARLDRRTLIGLGVGTAGLVLLLLTWAQIKDLQNVAAQIPYVTSGGLTGAALTVIGAIVLYTSPGARPEESVRAELRGLAETTDWVADAVERIARYLNEAAAATGGAERPAASGRRSR